MKERLDRLKAELNTCESESRVIPVTAEMKALFESGYASLTKTERAIFSLYMEGKNTVAVRNTLFITENTLKYHNRNIYGKLGVSSRKELVALAKTLEL